MKVLLIGKTEVDLFPLQGNSRHVMPGKAEGSEFQKRVAASGGEQGGQELIEFAGRLCYESWDMPNKATAENSGYIANILDHKHESVLEHVSVTFYVEGVSRNLSHELIRHRHLSFSELSQRYVDMADARYVLPPLWREVEEDQNDIVPMPVDHAEKYEHNVQAGRTLGANRKQAREAARYSLPAATETKFVVSGNLRAWRDVLKKRLSSHADAEMQLFAKAVREILSRKYPDVFADIEFDGE